MLGCGSLKGYQLSELMKCQSLRELMKCQKFFKPYLQSAIYAFKNQNVGFDLCREILSDSLPVDDKFILDYLKSFPERLDTRVIDLSVDTSVRIILHDAILRHAIEYLDREIKKKKP